MAYGIRRYRGKLVVVGDKSCGKTCLLRPVYIPRVCRDYTADVEVDGKHAELLVCDTVGGYEHLRRLSYLDKHVILICFAIDSPDSLENVMEKWISKVLHFCLGMPIILVGCKSDLRHDPNTINELGRTSQTPATAEEGEHVREKIGACKYMECSAKTGEGVVELFEAATRACIPMETGKRKKWWRLF
ncbi:P-loop containing nucleoside triphosphate hydrolase protein [Aspergillus californicus]